MRILVLFLVLIISACSSSSPEQVPQAEAAVAAAAVPIETAKVEVRELDRFVEAVGTLDPNEEVTITNQVESTVERVFVDLGDAVRQGQLIAQLDTRELELATQ